MISYLIESLAFQLLFLGLYELALRRTTFFEWNRYYLLGGCVISLLLPLVELEILGQAASSNPSLAAVSQAIIFLEGVELTAEGTGFGFREALILLWSTGVLISLVLLVWKGYQLVGLYRRGIRERLRTYTLIRLPGSEEAFSFFRFVFLGDRLDPDASKVILRHERVHIRKAHSADLVLMEFLRVVFWFNPLLSIYRKYLVEVHEFTADAGVEHDHRKKYYQHLVSSALGIRNLSIVNPFFNQNLIKKRIIMLQKKASHSHVKFLYALCIPLIAMMLGISSCQEDPNPAETSGANMEQSNEALSKTDASNIAKTPDSPEAANVSFAVIDQVPVYPGCEDTEDPRACFNIKIQEHIMKNFKYPEAAREQGIEGRVAVMFTIGSDGKIADIKEKGPDPILEAEVNRIISLLPEMQPGKHGGKAVNVPFSIPIMFKLD